MKVLQVWNVMSVSKWKQNYHFWTNYPFKTGQLSIVISVVMYEAQLTQKSFQPNLYLFWNLSGEIFHPYTKIP